jgi:hypothetical protein
MKWSIVISIAIIVAVIIFGGKSVYRQYKENRKINTFEVIVYLCYIYFILNDQILSKYFDY